jgi:hypothetical protein
LAPRRSRKTSPNSAQCTIFCAEILLALDLDERSRIASKITQWLRQMPRGDEGNLPSPLSGGCLFKRGAAIRQF